MEVIYKFFIQKMKEHERNCAIWTTIWNELANRGHWDQQLVDLGLKPDLQKRGIQNV